MKIRPSIRILILGGIFFVLFLNLITYINSVSSLRNRHSNFVAEKEQIVVEKDGFESDILKQARDSVNSRNNQEGLVRINPNEIKRPIDIQRAPQTSASDSSQSTSTEIGIIGR